MVTNQNYNEEVPRYELKQIAGIALKVLDTLPIYEAAIYIAHTIFGKSSKLIARQFNKSKVLDNVDEITVREINRIISKIQDRIREETGLLVGSSK